MSNQKALEHALMSFENGDLDKAAAQFETLVAELPYWAHFFLGRIEMERKKLNAARTHFEKANAANAATFWCNFELLGVLLQTEAPLEEARATITALMATQPPDTVDPRHWMKLVDSAHKVFEVGERKLGANLLAFVHGHGPEEVLGELGLVRVVEEGSDHALRRRLADALQARVGLMEVTKRVLGTYFESDDARLGVDPLEEAEVAEASASSLSSNVSEVAAQPSGSGQGKNPDRPSDKPEDAAADADADMPPNFAAHLDAVKEAIAVGDIARTATLRAHATRYPLRQRTFLELIAEIELNQATEALPYLLDLVRLFNDAPKFPAIRLTYMFLDLVDWRNAETILAILWAYHPDSPDVALVTVSALIRTSHLAAASDVFDRYLEQIPEKTDQILNVQSELLMAKGELSGALEVLNQLSARDNPPRGIINSLVRVAAEQRRWEDVFKLTTSNLKQDVTFRGMLEPMVRAAREIGRVREAYDLISEIDMSARPGHRIVQHALFEDLVVAGDTALLAQAEAIGLSDERRARIIARLKGQRAPALPAGRNQIYFCADESYLEPAITSITSLVMSNMRLMKTTGVSIIVEPEVVARAEAEVAPLRAALGVEVVVVDAQTLIPDAHTLRTNYGMLTGGHELSVAAYYRIFFAHALAKSGTVDRALYIDADTLVRPGLEAVFEIALSTPIAARPEVSRPEIELAEEAHGLEHTYFNSGVLLFDFTHAETKACLNASVAAALDPDTLLYFQDQCALNIGFNGQVTALERRFNYFVTPDSTYSDENDRDAVVVHYLDRPKPWDSLYQRSAQEWLTWWQIRANLQEEGKEENAT